MPIPEQQRRFAVEVVRRLREAGFEALWAGGCVRDQMLDRMPVDYDVATNATPEQIRRLFGHRRTLAIGAAFGVITVLGPKPAGAVEVATFRKETTYSDGRHPDQVTFSSAEEDASRRDFTINGLFYDPLEERVIDFVGGCDDLRRGVIRAIGDPRERFSEDKLRMLRAVRFSANFDFPLEADTLTAIGRMADGITVVSPERIAVEMRRMLVGPRPSDAVRMMIDTGLAAAILPEIVPRDDAGKRRLETVLEVVSRLSQPGFPLALAALLHESADGPAVRKVCRRWRLSNQETDRSVWLVDNLGAVSDAPTLRWSVLQKILISEGIEDLLSLHEAARPADAEDVAYCRAQLRKPCEQLDPPPLITGDDLAQHGIPPGPKYRDLLAAVRDAQLDEEILTRSEALAMVDRMMGNGSG